MTHTLACRPANNQTSDMIIARCVASLLPNALQDEFRRWRFLASALTGSFRPPEPEYEILPNLVNEGDWVLDIGANVGQYTLLLSRLVGPSGRVVAIEPMAVSVATLACVARLAPSPNISILNVAASERVAVVSLEVPTDSAGLRNFERARVSQGRGVPVLAITIDALQLPNPIALAKIDAEGHELPLLKGMRLTLERDHPVLIVENNDAAIPQFLGSLGYRFYRVSADSPNLLYDHADNARFCNLKP